MKGQTKVIDFEALKDKRNRKTGAQEIIELLGYPAELGVNIPKDGVALADSVRLICVNKLNLNKSDLDNNLELLEIIASTDELFYIVCDDTYYELVLVAPDNKISLVECATISNTAEKLDTLKLSACAKERVKDLELNTKALNISREGTVKLVDLLVNSGDASKLPKMNILSALGLPTDDLTDMELHSIFVTVLYNAMSSIEVGIKGGM
jgi:hypothetical protein